MDTREARRREVEESRKGGSVEQVKKGSEVRGTAESIREREESD